MGLQFLNDALPGIDPARLEFIRRASGLGLASVLIGIAVGIVVTLLIHSSSASIALMITLAFRQLINYEMAVSMIMGANIGTTIDAILAAFGARTAARRTALVHVLFNTAGTVVALFLFRPLLLLVDYITPGPPDGNGVAAHLAMFHTVFNVFCAMLFIPFVKQFAAAVSFLIKEDSGEARQPGHYQFAFRSASIQDTPELSMLQAEKEIRDMAGIASSMYASVSGALKTLRERDDRKEMIAALTGEMKEKEAYADEMRECLTSFLIECTREQLSPRSERRVSRLLRIIADLEDMTDGCYSVSLLLERSVRKDHIFKHKEMDALVPYVSLVEEFLTLVREHLGQRLTQEQIGRARELEEKIDKSRNKLRKLGRKRIEAGVDVKTELLFIDLVRRIEKLGDYCFDIAATMAK
jgi:phosphate:Na+ symporter